MSSNSLSARTGWILVAPVLAIACRDAPAPGSAAKPATVSKAVKEAELATITLTEDAEKRLAIATAAVERKSVARTRTVGGEIAAPSGSALAITAPVAGTLQSPGEMPVAGSAVSRGQTLFRLTPLQPSERDAAVDAQQAAEASAAKREAASRKAERAERLLKDGAGSRRALEEAQAELAVAEAEMTAARGRVALAGRIVASNGSVPIEAPENGIIQAVHASAGQSVAANAPIIDLVRLATVWVRVPIYAGESANINPAAPAQVLTLGDPPEAEGMLARPIPAPPSANATTAGVDLYYAMTNSGPRFRPGERVAVRLVRRDTAEGLVVPKAALLHDAYGGTWVYVSRGAQVYARQRVALADISGGWAMLTQGPPPGSRVVTDGAAELFGVEFGAGK